MPNTLPLYADVVPGRANGLIPQLYLEYSRAPEHRMKMRMERWIRRFLRVSTVRASSPAGVWYDLRTDDYVQAVIIRSGSYEPNTLKLMQSLLAPGDTMVDIGGHVGQYALHAAKWVGRTGRVVVAEPNPEIYCRLLHNIRLNRFDQITPVLGAIASHAAVTRMVVPVDYNTSAAFISREAAGSSSFAVLTIPLQSMLESVGVDRVDVLKVDVEGFEPYVFGSMDLDSRLRPKHILFEYQPNLLTQQGSDPRSLLDALRAADYALTDVLGEPLGDPEALLELNIWARDLRHTGSRTPRTT